MFLSEILWRPSFKNLQSNSCAKCTRSGGTWVQVLSHAIIDFYLLVQQWVLIFILQDLANACGRAHFYNIFS